MTVEQAAKDLLSALHLMYQNDFGGYQASSDDALDIDFAMDRLEEALAQPRREWAELTRGEIMSMDLPVDASVIDLAWAIEAKVREKNL